MFGVVITSEWSNCKLIHLVRSKLLSQSFSKLWNCLCSLKQEQTYSFYFNHIEFFLQTNTYISLSLSDVKTSNLQNLIEFVVAIFQTITQKTSQACFATMKANNLVGLLKDNIFQNENCRAKPHCPSSPDILEKSTQHSCQMIDVNTINCFSI